MSTIRLMISLEEVDSPARGPHNVVISCYMKLNLEYLVEVLGEHWIVSVFIPRNQDSLQILRMESF